MWGRWYWRNHIRGPQDLIAVTFLRCVLSQNLIYLLSFSYNIFGLPCTQWRSLTMWWVLAAILVGSNARVNNNNNDGEREEREKLFEGLFSWQMTEVNTCDCCTVKSKWEVLFWFSTPNQISILSNSTLHKNILKVYTLRVPTELRFHDSIKIKIFFPFFSLL